MMAAAQLFQATISERSLAIRIARGVVGKGAAGARLVFVHKFSHCRKHLCHTPKFFARIDLIVDIPCLRDGIQDAGTRAKEGNALKAADAKS